MATVQNLEFEINERLKAEVAELRKENERLTSELQIATNSYDVRGFTIESYIKRVNTQEKTIKRLTEENERLTARIKDFDELKIENNPHYVDLINKASYRIKELEVALEKIEHHLGPYKWCDINKYVECKSIIMKALSGTTTGTE